ncbi:MAG: ATP synthase F1 subunit delta [Armatimonadetes bacterium]|nr:ATP synthase F1 subunit delta [Armatimonadota bacterium]
MRMTTLARRYAGALFGVAKSADGIDVIDNVESDLGLIGHSLQTMPRLAEALNHPLIPPARKKAIVSEVFGGRVQDVTLRFLLLVVEKRREAVLPDVEQEYVRLANEHRGLVSVSVTSAVPLEEDQIAALKAGLDGFTGKQTELVVRVDPDIIGGVAVRIGDTVVDGSVRGYLASLREKMLG